MGYRGSSDQFGPRPRPRNTWRRRESSPGGEQGAAASSQARFTEYSLPATWTCQQLNIIVWSLSLREETMRMLLRVSIPVETGNAAAKAGTLGSTIERILADLKPEAAYFFADDEGKRAGSIVFDMRDTSQIPAIAKPWFLAFNAKVLFRPITNPQDLAKAGPSIGNAAKEYGR